MQEHVWLTETFSVRKETLCFHEKTFLPPGADYRNPKARKATGLFCCLGAGHKGKHEFKTPDVRLYGFQEAKL